jgi:hypothetical protein
VCSNRAAFWGTAISTLLVAFSVPLVPETTAQTTTAQVLSAGQTVALTEAGVSLMVPRDGRLAGYGFLTAVTGAAFTSTAGAGSDSVQASPGDQLVVVAATETDTNQGFYYDYGNSGPIYQLVSGQLKVDLATAASGSYVWAVSIPDGAPASLVATNGGFSQSFDLRTGSRTGSSPVALYRDPTSPAATQTLSASQTLRGTGSGADPASLTIAPSEAVLGYFQPNETLTAPPPPDKAWLMVAMGFSRMTDATGHRLTTSGVFDAPAVVLQTAAGTINPIEVSTSPTNNGPFPGAYAFEVPATLTTATLVFNLNGIVPATNSSGTSVNITFTPTVADIAIALPPVQASPGQGYAPAAAASPTPSATTSIGAGRALSSHRHGGATWPYLVAVALALVILAGGLVGRRRYRRDPLRLWVTPITRTPRRLLRGSDLYLPAASGLPYEPAALPAASPESAGVGADPAGVTAVDERADPVGTELVVSLLGPIRVDGLRRPIRRKAVTRLFLSVAVHFDRAVSVEELRDLMAVDPDQPESTENIYSFSSMLRSSLPAGCLPTIGAGEAGYQLSMAVDIDWAVFSQLAATFRRGDDPTAAVAAGLDALSLIRGVPLAHSGWHGIDAAVRHIQTTIENLAADVARAALAARDARSAETAIGQGLLAVPGSLVLWDIRLHAAAAGSGYGLERTWTKCQEELGADARALEATYLRLRNGDF